MKQNNINEQKHIVVVDDEIEFLKTVQLYLEEDYKVTLCSSGIQAINVCKTELPDLILLDIMMPVLNGVQVLNKLYEYTDLRQIPVILVSGIADKNIIMECFKLGVVGYLVKPIDKESLLVKVVEVINKTSVVHMRKTVMVIDDELESLKVVKTYLEEEYNVITMKSGKHAIGYLAKSNVDVILLDYNMPLFDGETTIKMLRSLEATKHIPVIFLTGSADSAVIARCMEYKPEGYLAKPVSKNSLLATVKSVIDNGVNQDDE